MSLLMAKCSYVYLLYQVLNYYWKIDTCIFTHAQDQLLLNIFRFILQHQLSIHSVVNMCNEFVNNLCNLVFSEV